MFGCYPQGYYCGGGVGVGNFGGSTGQGYRGYGGSTFVLIVVLFILLIIVGGSFL